MRKPCRSNADLACVPSQTDRTLEDYNVDAIVDAFVTAVQDAVSHSAPSGHVMFNMGADFQYEVAGEYFKNLDRLMDAVNADGRVAVRYSTPSQYVTAVHAANLTWTVKTDDFFPCTYAWGHWMRWWSEVPSTSRLGWRARCRLWDDDVLCRLGFQALVLDGLLHLPPCTEGSAWHRETQMFVRSAGVNHRMGKSDCSP